MILEKRVFLAVICGLCLLISGLTGCVTDTAREYADNPVAERETLTQISTIDAILNGVYDGVMTYDILKGYGDFGIGTFNALDGEMLAFNGDFYQIRSDGIAYPVSNTMETPFASVTFFDVDYTGKLPEGLNYAELEEYLDSILPSENTFYAIKIEGTLVGFRSPPYVAGVNVPGYHLHFLTRNKDAGGHVLEFIIVQADISIDYTSGFLMILPGEGSAFYKIDLTPNKQDEMEQAEK